MPKRLKDAMRYALFSGGKRIRPFLLSESASLFHVPSRRALYAGAALECVHAYSLVHDDLPAMDNAGMRRGKPSVHKKFNEATAILAGDALLTLAFEILSRPAVHRDATIRAELIQELSKAAGASGMVGGQMLDLELEGRWRKKKPTLKTVRVMETLKTAKLFSVACEAGAILGRASQKDRVALARYGLLFGQAFQIADDLADVKADKAARKITFLTAHGQKAARTERARLIKQAEEALLPFGKRANSIRDYLKFL